MTTQKIELRNNNNLWYIDSPAEINEFKYQIGFIDHACNGTICFTPDLSNIKKFAEKALKKDTAITVDGYFIHVIYGAYGKVMVISKYGKTTNPDEQEVFIGEFEKDKFQRFLHDILEFK